MCAVGWNFDWLSDVGFIGILALSLLISLCTVQFLLVKLHRYGGVQNTQQRDNARLKSQVKLLLT